MDREKLALARETQGTSTVDLAPRCREDRVAMIGGIVVPDTPIVSRTIECARGHCEPYLFNHVMLSWLFAVAVAQLKRSQHDPELLAVATT